MTEVAVLHPVSGPPGSRLARLMGMGLQPVAPLRGANGCLDWVVGKVAGPHHTLEVAGSGLSPGAARDEALAVQLRRHGVELRWGDPTTVSDLGGLLDFCRARGRSSVKLIRADPSLLTHLQIGAWFDGSWRMRLLRRTPLMRSLARSAIVAERSRRWLAAAADLAFWAGVRESATAQEWRRLTAHSYVALLYHRFTRETKPGQERINVTPKRFERQLRVLRLARFRALDPARILSFHGGEADHLPPRSYTITVDDALSDCIAPLARHANLAPQLFVCTRELGQSADWIDGDPVATWEEIQALAACGIAIGSHARRHRALTELDESECAEELAGSRADLRERLTNPLEMVAFPYGYYDASVSEAARSAGFQAAYTTQKGRNGSGTDPHCLHRVSIHADDGLPAFLWKAITGEELPGPWLKLRALRLRWRR